MRSRASKFWIALEWAASLLVAAVFLLASVPKILNPAAFASAVYQMDVLPDLLVNPVAIFLPWIEFIAACTLVFLPPARRAALALIGLLLTTFTFVLMANFLRGTAMSCGCFGGTFLEALFPPWTAPLRNLLLLGLVCIALEATRLRE
ncbi:MAG: MauE/DoxX family redox-associated membrane protein [Spartobacteria bacterium]